MKAFLNHKDGSANIALFQGLAPPTHSSEFQDAKNEFSDQFFMKSKDDDLISLVKKKYVYS